MLNSALGVSENSHLVRPLRGQLSRQEFEGNSKILTNILLNSMGGDAYPPKLSLEALQKTHQGSCCGSHSGRKNGKINTQAGCMLGQPYYY